MRIQPVSDLHLEFDQDKGELDPGVLEIDGTRFVGATLWFRPTPDEEGYRRFLLDFTLIPEFVPWVHDTHARHLAITSMNPELIIEV